MAPMLRLIGECTAEFNSDLQFFMVGPFGRLDQALKDLHEIVFAGKRMKMLQATRPGGVAVVER
jgi:hypothetical protein